MGNGRCPLVTQGSSEEPLCHGTCLVVACTVRSYVHVAHCLDNLMMVNAWVLPYEELSMEIDRLLVLTLEHSLSVENIHRVRQWRPPKKAGLDPIVASFHFVLPCDCSYRAFGQSDLGVLRISCLLFLV